VLASSRSRALPKAAIVASIASAWIADIVDAARAAAAVVDGAVVTLDGVVYRGAHQVEGGAHAESRGILATKREIKELRERLEAGREAVERLREEIASLDMLVAGADSAIGTVQAELHRQEKDHRRFRAAGAQRRGCARADRPETGADQRRAAHRRRGVARPGSPARTRPGPPSPGSKRNSAAPTIA
jgi:chromosome segregation ATPase